MSIMFQINPQSWPSPKSCRRSLFVCHLFCDLCWCIWTRKYMEWTA